MVIDWVGVFPHHLSVKKLFNNNHFYTSENDLTYTSLVCNTLVKIRKILLTRYISFGLPRKEKVADSYNK